MPSERRWRLNPTLQQQPFDQDRWLFELRDGRGGTQRTLVPNTAARVLLSMRDPISESELERTLSNQGMAEDARQRLREVVFEDAVRRRIVVESDVSEFDAPRQMRRPHYMTAMVQILGPSLVNPIASRLSPLFSRAGLAVGMAIALLGQALLMHALLQPRSFAAPTSPEVLAVIALGVVVLLVHELGHAACAWRFGARHVSIGAGWYVLFPVAYADLSEIWGNSPRQRMLIDVAGVFAQSLLVAPMLVVYHATGNALWIASATAASLSVLWNLNPLLRLDGYWLLSDFLGSSNLRAEASAAVRAYWARLRRRQTQQPHVDGPRPRAGALLALYGAAAGVFFVTVCGLAVFAFADALVRHLPTYVDALLQAGGNQRSLADHIVVVGGAAWNLLLLGFLGRFLLQLAMQLGRRVRRSIAWRSLTGILR